MTESIKEINTLHGVYTETIGTFEIETNYVNGVKHGVSTVRQNSVVIQCTTWENGKVASFKRNVQVGPTGRTKVQELEINKFGSVITIDGSWISRYLDLNNRQMMWTNKCSKDVTLVWSTSDAAIVLSRDLSLANKRERICPIDESDMHLLIDAIPVSGKLSESDIGYFMLKYI